MTKSKNLLCLDLDGVVIDFTSAACEIHGRPGYHVSHWDWYLDWGMTPAQFWKPIKDAGEAFYAELAKPYPWMDELLSIVDEAAEHVLIKSACTTNPASWSGKVIWWDKYIPAKYKKWELDLGSEKYWLAAPGRILVDDYVENIKAFRDYGGCAYLFPQPWNGYTGSDPIARLRAALDNWKVGEFQS